MKYNYLTIDELTLQLQNRKPVQKWIGYRDDNGFRYIKWIEIDPTRNNTYAIYEKECLDSGSEDDFDLTQFITVGDPDEPEGKRTEINDVESVIEYLNANNIDLITFVKFCEIQYIYLEFIKKMGQPLKSINDWYQ